MALIFKPSMPKPPLGRCLFLLLVAFFYSFTQDAISDSLSRGLSYANQQNPISVTSELVAIPVSVTDRQGNFVPGLAREDFRIYEDDQLREITLFEQEDTPVSVGLLVDHSGSMGSKLPDVATAISGFTRASNPQDEMFIVDFSDEAKLEMPDGKAFTSDPSEIQRAVLGISAQGRTALYDAVAAGLITSGLLAGRKKR